MSKALSNLNPADVFEYFEEICAVPRETDSCDGICAYLRNFAGKYGLDFKEDDAHNIVIFKPASFGYEGQEPVILQCHTDIVGEKSYELEGKFDFAKDPITPLAMDDFVFGKGTSLGANDGIAMAYMLSVLADDSLDHPKLEALFTVNKHRGFKGAFALDGSMLTGKRLINLDHTVEGEILTSSAGGRKVKMSFGMKTEEYEGCKFNLVICGLAGGHSGTEIDKCRGNANLLMGRFVHFIGKEVPIRIGYLKGGLVDYTIPREAKAEIYVRNIDEKRTEDLISEFISIIEKEYGDVEDNLTIYGENLGPAKSLVLDLPSQKKVGLVMNDIPDGIIKMSRNGDDLVQTSLNCGIMRLDRHHFELFINIRSTQDCEKKALSDRLQYLTEYLDGEFSVEFEYPAWEYDEDSDFRDIAFDIYQRCFEKNPKLTGFHAGLECGILYDKLGGLDIISFGPNITGADTIKERLSVSSAERCYELLVEILANC